MESVGAHKIHPDTMSHHFPNLQARHHHAAKDDDQIAYENGYSCECAGRYDQALNWYSEVKPAGNHWDMSATASRIAILLAMGRSGEAVQHGTCGLDRMQHSSLMLINEAARAWNQHRGPQHALTVMQTWARQPAIRNTSTFLHSTAAYAAQCGQFALSLEYLLEWLKIRSHQPAADILLDMDLVPLWQHLAKERLTPDEVTALRSSRWPTDIEGLSVHDGDLSFESRIRLPARLGAILSLHTPSMSWRVRPGTAQPLLRAYAQWRKETRSAHFEKLLTGRRKAVAFKASVKTE